MKIIFFGTPDFAKDFLSKLYLENFFEIIAIVAQPDKKVGRKKTITAPSTKIFAENNKITVLQPENLKDADFINELKKLKPDLFVVVAYGKIIPIEVLDIPKKGTINVHPSLLPKYRGPSPLQAVIAAGDDITGVTIMKMDKRMDHGPIIAQTEVGLDFDETPKSLMKKILKIGAPLLIESIKKIKNNKIELTVQNDENASFCQLLKRDDGKISWDMSSEKIDRMIRAFDIWPGVFVIWSDNSRLKIHKAKISNKKLSQGELLIDDNRVFIGTSTKALELIEVQPENKNKMSAIDFIRGLK